MLKTTENKKQTQFISFEGNKRGVLNRIQSSTVCNASATNPG